MPNAFTFWKTSSHRDGTGSLKVSGFNSQFIDSLGSSRKTFEIPEGVELATEDHDPLAVDIKRFLIPSDLTFISYQPTCCKLKVAYNIL